MLNDQLKTCGIYISKNHSIDIVKEKEKCQTVNGDLKYRQFSPHKIIEQYAHHLLFAFYLFCQE